MIIETYANNFKKSVQKIDLIFVSIGSFTLTRPSDQIFMYGGGYRPSVQMFFTNNSNKVIGSDTSSNVVESDVAGTISTTLGNSLNSSVANIDWRNAWSNRNYKVTITFNISGNTAIKSQVINAGAFNTIPVFINDFTSPSSLLSRDVLYDKITVDISFEQV